MRRGLGDAVAASPRAAGSPSPRSSPSTSPASDGRLPHGVAARHARRQHRARPRGLDAVGRASRTRGAATGGPLSAGVAQRRGAEHQHRPAEERGRRVVGMPPGDDRLGLERAVEERVALERARRGRRRRPRRRRPPRPRCRRARPASGSPFSTDSSSPPRAPEPPQDLGRGEGRGVARGVSRDARVRDRADADAGLVAERRRGTRSPMPGDRDAEAVEARPHVRGGARRVRGGACPWRAARRYRKSCGAATARRARAPGVRGPAC